MIVNSKAQIAVAVAAGYALGRRQKLRLALALAVAGATGRLGSRQRGLLQQGIKVLSSSPEVEKITAGVRDGLMEAGKAAAVAAASKQINSLSSKLSDRAESLRHPGESGDGADDSEETAGSRTNGKAKARKVTDRLRREERVRGASSREEEPQEDEEDFSDDEPQATRREKDSNGMRRERASSSRSRKEEQRDDDDEEDFSDDEPQARQEKVQSGVRRESPSSSDRPVRRVRR
jgi:hypothetical protein